MCMKIEDGSAQVLAPIALAALRALSLAPDAAKSDGQDCSSMHSELRIRSDVIGELTPSDVLPIH